MLVLTRKPGHIVEIRPDTTLDLSTPVGELFAQGPIQVTTLQISSTHVRLGISADSGFLILRSELCRE